VDGKIFNSRGVQVAIVLGPAIFDLKGKKLYDLKGVNIYKLYQWLQPEQSSHVAKVILLELAANGFEIVKKGA
jgi:hypothetical protein